MSTFYNFLVVIFGVAQLVNLSSCHDISSPSAPQHSPPTSPQNTYCKILGTEEQKKFFFDLAYEALLESFQELGYAKAARDLQATDVSTPLLLHCSGDSFIQLKNEQHVTLCYGDSSWYTKCSEVQRKTEIKPKKLYLKSLKNHSLAIGRAGSYGSFVALTLSPESVTHEGTIITDKLHLSLIKIQDNPGLKKTVIKNLQRRLHGLNRLSFEIKRIHCTQQ